MWTKSNHNVDDNVYDNSFIVSMTLFSLSSVRRSRFPEKKSIFSIASVQRVWPSIGQYVGPSCHTPKQSMSCILHNSIIPSSNKSMKEPSLALFSRWRVQRFFHFHHRHRLQNKDDFAWREKNQTSNVGHRRPGALPHHHHLLLQVISRLRRRLA